MEKMKQKLDINLQNFKKFIDKDKVTIFLVTILTAMVAHFQLYALVLTGPDTLLSSIYHPALGESTLGRFGLYFVQIVKGNVVSPILATLLSCVFLGLTVILIIEILHIKKRYLKIILAILFAVAPNISVTLTFFYCSDAYIIGMFLATLAVFLVRKFEKRKWMVLLGGICIAWSMGMYQTYLSVTMVLCMATLLIDLLEKKSTKEIGIDTLKYVVMGVLGIAFYYIFSHLTLKLRHMAMSDYSGANEIGLATLLQLPELLPQSYESFFRYFFTDAILPNSVWYTNVIYIVLFSVIAITTIYLVITQKIYKNKINTVLILVLIVIAPICFGVIEIMVPKVYIHLLMACSMIFVFPIFFRIIEMLPKDNWTQILKSITIICSVLIIWNYTWQDNASYIVMKLQKEQLETVMNRVVTRIEQLENYEPSMPILIAGQIQGNSYFNRNNTARTEKAIYNMSYRFVANWSLIWQDNISSWTKFFYEYLGVNVKIVTPQMCKPIIEDEEYKSMKAYPANNSVKIINNTVVVKLQ